MNREMIAEELVKMAKSLTAEADGQKLLKKIGIKPKKIVKVVEKGQTTRVIFELGHGFRFNKKQMNRMMSNPNFQWMQTASGGAFLVDFKGL